MNNKDAIKNLSIKALLRTAQQLKSYGNAVSQEAMQALYSVMETLSGMAFGAIDDKYYLYSAFPGSGKTTAVVQWILTMIEAGLDVGVLICVDRLEQIAGITSQLPKDKYSVWVQSGHDLNDAGLGKARIDEAQVLITTKAQIHLHAKDGPFRSATGFYYMGTPRPVRWWDEGLILGEPVAISLSSLGTLIERVAKNEPLLVDICKVIAMLSKCKDGEVIRIPEFEVPFEEVDRLFKWDPRITVVDAFWKMSGKPITVRTSDKGRFVVDYVESVPSDFAPCLVTDASGSVRETYHLQEKERGNLVRLKVPPSDCSNMKIHLFRHPSTKYAYKTPSRFDTIVEETVSVILAKPNEKFLVIHLGGQDDKQLPNLEKAICNRLGPCASNVSFLNFGRHTATNQYADITNVLLVGTLLYSPPQNEALIRAAAGRPTSKGIVTPDELKRFKVGEMLHHTLQAVTRGSIRVANSEPFNLWMITDQDELEKGLGGIFPSAEVTTWSTNTIPLKGRALVAYELIDEYLNEYNFTEIPTKVIWKAMGLKDGYAFREILRNKNLLQAINQLGLVWTEDRSMLVIPNPFEYFFGDESI